VVRRSKNYLVHDEMGCQPGDLVSIVESRPLSKMKRWAVEQVVRRAQEAQVAASLAAVDLEQVTEAGA